MSMFDNYNKDSEKSCNITSSYFRNIEKVDVGSILYTRDTAGNLIKVSWNENDKFLFKDTINVNIIVDSSSKIYEVTTLGPTEKTEGDIGQRAYNTVDWRCWICKGQKDEKYIWKETTLYQDLDGNKIIPLQFPSYNTTITANILNFRRETIYTFDFHNTTQVSIPIDKEKLPLLVQGQYFVELILSNEVDSQTLKTLPITIY